MKLIYRRRDLERVVDAVPYISCSYGDSSSEADAFRGLCSYCWGGYNCPPYRIDARVVHTLADRCGAYKPHIQALVDLVDELTEINK